MGARFTTDFELVKQEPVQVELIVDEEVYLCRGQIIFSMAARPADIESFYSGVVFVGQDVRTCDRLRAILIRWYMELVQDKMDQGSFQKGLAFFDLAPEERQLLSRID